MIKQYCIGNVCKPLSVWGKLFDISAPTLKHRLNKGLSLIEAICFASKKEKHGLTGSKEYYTWVAIKDRCLNPNNKNYKHYGARGITICEEWVLSFQAFYDYVGKAPEGKDVSIDRIDNTKGYEPGNVRWVVNRDIQSINKRTYSNNTSGVKGIVFYKKANKWLARISVNKKHIHLGSFSDINEAIAARKLAEEKYHKPLLK